MATPAAPAPVAGTPTAQAQPSATPGSGPAAATATPAEIRKLKLKLDGQDVEMAESEVIALAQQGKVAGKRFQEAASLRKQAEDVIRFAKENPTEFFNRTGMNARQWAEEYLVGELKREQMTPEQKKAHENEMKLKKYADDEKAAKIQKEQADREALQKQHHDNYERVFIEALGKSGLPKTPYTMKRMAELQLVNLRKKLDLTADQLVKVVKEDYANEHKMLLGGFTGDQLMEFLGPDLVKKLSKAQIAKLKAKASSGGVVAPRSTTTDSPQMSWKDYQRRNRRLT